MDSETTGKVEEGTEPINEEGSIRQGNRNNIAFFDIGRVIGKGGHSVVYEGFFNLEEFRKRYELDPKEDSYLKAKHEDIDLIERIRNESSGKHSGKLGKLEEKIFGGLRNRIENMISKSRWDRLEEEIEKQISDYETEDRERQEKIKERAGERIRMTYCLITGKERDEINLEEIENVPVVVKVLKEESSAGKEGYQDLTLLNHMEQSSISTEGRFKKEFDITDLLRRFSVPVPIMFGYEDGKYFMAVEKIDTDMNKYYSNSVMQLDKLYEVAYQLLDTLGFAHKSGNFHRDIKPENIGAKLDEEGNIRGVRLMDWGIVKMEGSHTLTNDDEALGTPVYMAPEQLLPGGVVSSYTDIYSLGATFVSLLTAHQPRYLSNKGNDWGKDLIESEGPEVLPSEIREDIPEEVDNILLKMMENDFRERYQDAEEVSNDFKKVQEGESPDTKDYTTRKVYHYGLSHLIYGINKYNIITGKKLNIDFENDEELTNFLEEFRDKVYRIKVNNILNETEEGKFIFDSESKDSKHFLHENFPSLTAGEDVGLMDLCYRYTGEERFKERADRLRQKILDQKEKVVDTYGVGSANLFYRAFSGEEGGNLFEWLGEKLVKDLYLQFDDNLGTFKSVNNRYEGESMIVSPPRLIPFLSHMSELDRSYQEKLNRYMNFNLNAHVEEDNTTIPVRIYDTNTGEFLNKNSLFKIDSNVNGEICRTNYQTSIAKSFIEYYMRSGREEFLDTAKGLMQYYIDNIPKGEMPGMHFRDSVEGQWQSDAAVNALVCFSYLHDITNDEEYKKHERNALEAIIFNSLDIRSDSQVLVNYCTVSPTRINVGRVEPFYELVNYIESYLDDE